MSTYLSGRSRLAIGLTLAVLAACADQQQYTTGLSPASGVQLALFAGQERLVTNPSGGTDSGSLRWVVQQAADGDVIHFDSSLAGTTIYLENTLVIDKPLTIEGPSDRGITIAPVIPLRLIDVLLGSGEVLTLRNLTLTGGYAGGQNGGAMYVVGGQVVVENSTLYGNKAAAGGAIFSTWDVKLVNSTVTGNVSTGGLAVLFAYEDLEVFESTVAYNTGGGVVNPSILRNSIVAHNSTTNCGGTNIVRLGRNLSDTDACGGEDVMLIAEPMLDSVLAVNGGPTKTLALDRRSPAINAGAYCTLAVDQRYVSRDSSCDIGAFEFRDFTTVDLRIDGSVMVSPTTGWAVVTGTIQCSRDEQFDLAVAISQDQRGGRVPVTIQAADTTTIQCGTAMRGWSISLTPAGGVFTTGSAVIDAKAADLPQWIRPAAASDTVRMYWGHR